MDQEERARMFRNHQQRQMSAPGENPEPEQTDDREMRLKKQRNLMIHKSVLMAIFLISCVGTVLLLGNVFTSKGSEETSAPVSSGEGTSTQEVSATVAASESTPAYDGWPPVDTSNIVMPDWIKQDFLTVNEFSRPVTALDGVKDIVIHWVGNPDTSAESNRDYFDNLRIASTNPEGVKASAHFVVGLEGEVIQCLPLYEMAYAVKEKRNPDTISIEVCHPDWGGEFNEVTYQSVVRLTAWLLDQFELDNTHILRHYDITGKDCPKYYVNNPDAWEQLKQDIAAYRETNPQ